MAGQDGRDPLQIELVAADRVVWSGEASEISARTVEGDLGVLRGHAPLLSLLVPGVVTIHPAGEGDVVRAVVAEGFISVADDHVSILSEEISLADELDKAEVDAELESARESGDDDAVRRAEAKAQLVS